MQLDLDDAAFRSVVNRWLEVLGDEEIGDLATVFERCPGVYPTTLLPLWTAERERRGLKSPEATPLSLANPTKDSLPVGHALDSDWRFTPETAVHLAQLAASSAEPGACVAHVGTPSTFLRCVASHADLRHFLLDRNITMIDALAHHGSSGSHMMLGVDLSSIHRVYLGAHSAIVDPPWYLEQAVLFLGIASQICRDNATILLCQPTLGTRPGIEGERAALHDLLPTLGLAVRAVWSAAVKYAMPHFEAVSLAAVLSGVEVPTSWRRGDLLVLERVAPPQRRGTDSLVSDGLRWREVAFGPVRIMLAPFATGLDLGQIVPGDVLQTVSRRDPLRPLIGFWTSGNRVFSLENPGKIGDLVEKCENDRRCNKFGLERLVDHAVEIGVGRDPAEKLFSLLTIELAEHQREISAGD